MLDFKKNIVENSKWIQALPENHCVIQICLWCFYTEVRKIIPGQKKKKWPLCFSTFIFLCNQEQLCQYVFSWSEDIECTDFKLVGTVCSGLVLRSHDNQFNYCMVYCWYMCWTFYGAGSGLLDAYLWLKGENHSPWL